MSQTWEEDESPIDGGILEAEWKVKLNITAVIEHIAITSIEAWQEKDTNKPTGKFPLDRTKKLAITYMKTPEGKRALIEQVNELDDPNITIEFPSKSLL